MRSKWLTTLTTLATLTAVLLGAAAVRARAAEPEVKLALAEPAGVARPAWPVTSGVPLPEGAVREAGELALRDAAGEPVPCQIEAVCRWPDGSLRWVHLSFQADLPAGGKLEYTLARGKPAAVARPLKVTEGGDSIVIDTGAARITISRKTGSIIESLEVGGEKVLKGRGMTLVGGTFVSKITRARYKHSGGVELGFARPRSMLKCGTETWTLRAADAGNVELVGSKTGPDGRCPNRFEGTWLSKSGKIMLFPTFEWGKHGFGEPGAESYWTFETDGSRNGKRFSTALGKLEKVEVEKSGPLVACVYLQGTFSTKDGDVVVPVGKDRAGKPYADPSGDFLKHRTRIYAYAGKPWVRVVPAITHLGPFDGSVFACFDDLAMEFAAPGVAAGSSATLSGARGSVGNEARLVQLLGVTPATENGLKRSPSYAVTFDGAEKAKGPKATGSCLIGGGAGPGGLGFGVRRFWEYGPKAITVSPGRVRLELWPSVQEFGGYRLGRGRQRSHEIMISASAAAEAELAAFQAPRLIAVAPGSWYADCGIFGMIAEERDYQEAGYPRGQLEALGRYEQMMKCVVDSKFSTRGARGRSAPAHFVAGWNDYGDLPWSDGWSNLHYDWTMNMLLHFLRTGKREFFDAADAMAWHRKDIAQNHSDQCGRVNRYQTGTNHISFYEKDDHRRIFARSSMFVGRVTHTWNRGIGYYYLLTGDPMARLVAVETAESLHVGFGGLIEGGKKAPDAGAELRRYGWSIENLLGAYEVTGEKKYLDWALALFHGTFGAIHEGRTIEKAVKMPPLMYGYSLSPICRLHHYTGDGKVLEGLRYLVDEAVLGRFVDVGRKVDGGKYLMSGTPYWWHKSGKGPRSGKGTVWNFFWGNPTAYLYMQTGEKKYLDLSRQFFTESIFYYTARYGPQAPDYRSELAYRTSLYASVATKIHGWSGRFNHIYLYMEKQLAGGAKFPVK
jgi:hypothetical protein